MSEHTVRRDVLKALSTTGITSTIPLTGIASAEAPLVRTVEAGVRYDVPANDNYSTLHIDSRPLYTVDPNNSELIVAEREHESFVSQLAQNKNLLNEQPVQEGNSNSIGPDDNRIRSLPIELTTRMRVNKVVKLTSGLAFPQVAIHWNGRAPTLNVQAKGQINLSPGSKREIELPPESVEVQTVRVNDDGERRQEDNSVYKRGTEIIEVTPIVEVVDHGELDLTRHQFP